MNLRPVTGRDGQTFYINAEKVTVLAPFVIEDEGVTVESGTSIFFDAEHALHVSMSMEALLDIL